MLRVVPRVQYGRLPGDRGTRLRGLGPPLAKPLFPEQLYAVLHQLHS